MEKFDINKLNKGKSKNIKIGELSKEVIDLLNLDLNPQNINIWSTRIQEHCEKHKSEYSSPSAYNQAVNSIPLIIFPISEIKLENSIKSGKLIPFN